MDYHFPNCLEENHPNCGAEKDGDRCSCPCHLKKVFPLASKSHTFWHCFTGKHHLCERMSETGGHCTCPCHKEKR